MEKNKIITSLTLAGILTAGVIGGNVNASSKASLGVCKDLIKGENLVPYVFDSAAERLVADAVRGEYKVTSTNYKNPNQVATGDKFATSKGSKTVLVYGDVNGNGVVDTFDASYAQQIYLGASATELQKLAANVNNGNDTVDTFDASRIQQFYLGNGTLVANPPKGEKEEDINYSYTVEVNGNNLVNNENKDESTVKVTPESGSFEKDLTFSLVANKVNEDGTYGSDVELVASIQPEVNQKYFETTADLSALSNDGTYRVQLKDAEGVVVAEMEITVNTTLTNINANVIARRVGSRDATVAVMSYGEKDIVKIYCQVAETAPSKDDVVEKGTAIAITNNELAEKLFTNANVGETGQKLYYVLEDSYGNRTAVASVDIADDDADNVCEVAIKTIEAKEDENEFTVTLDKAPSSTVNVNVTLYKDGKAIANEVKKGTDASFDTTAFDVAMKDENGKYVAGTYTVKAYVEGTSTNQPSATFASTGDDGKIVIETINAVKNVKFVANEDDKTEGTITFEDSQKDIDYTVEMLYPQYDANNKFTGEYKTTPSTNGGISAISAPVVNPDNAKEYTVTGLVANVAYKVRVTATPKTVTPQRRVAAETPAESEQFYHLNIGTPTIKIDSVNSATYTLAPITVKGLDSEKATYQAKVYSYVVSEDGNEESTTLVKTQNVTLEEIKGSTNCTAEVTGLEAGKTYKFVLVATLGNEKVEDVQTGIKVTAKVAPAINGLVVDNTVTDVKDAKKGFITLGSKYFIDGTEIDPTDYTTEFQALLADLAVGLVDGDKVTVSTDTIKVELGATGSASSTFGTNGVLKEKTLELVGNNAYRTVAIAATDDNKAKEVKLSSNSNGVGLFTISAELNAEKVTLNNVDVKESANGTYTLAAGRKSTINNVEATGSRDTVMTVENDTNEITLTAKASASNLTFNNVAKTTLNITIDGNADLALPQTGSITVTSTEGNVTISSDNATVSGNITANVENGILDVTANTLTGTKAVTVTNKKDTTNNETTTVTAKLKTKPVYEISANTEIKDYTKTDAEGNDSLDDLESAVTLGTAEIEEVAAFINSLGIPEEAKATVEVDSNGIITITVKGNVSGLRLSGLQSLI